MKKLISLFTLLSFFIVFTGTTKAAAFITAGDTIKPVPRINKEFLIVAHIVKNEQGTPVVTASEISSALSWVNSVFAPIGASFTVCDVREIPNFRYLELDGKIDDEVFEKYTVQNRINMYFVDSIKLNDNPYCGYARLGGITHTDFHSNIVIASNCLDVSTISHELGHYFGLPHTFEGSGTELADGSNCATAGDGICDTPADPFIDGDNMELYLQDCLFISTKKDAKGNYYDPDVSNIMSYYRSCTSLKFTKGQLKKMADTYHSKPFIW